MLLNKPSTFAGLPNRTQHFFTKLGHYSAEDLNGYFIPNVIYEDLSNHTRNIIQSDEPHTLLTFACHKHNPAIVKELLNRGADVNQVNGQGNPPLYYLINNDVNHSSQTCHILQKLLKEDEINFTTKCNDFRTILDHILDPNHQLHKLYEIKSLAKIDPAEASPALELILKAIADKIIHSTDFDEEDFTKLYPYFSVRQDDEFYREFMDCLADWHELSMEEKSQGNIRQEDLESFKLKLEALQNENIMLHNEISHLQESIKAENQPAKAIIASNITILSDKSNESLNTNSKPKNS